LFSLIKAGLVNPGSIPNGWNDKEFDRAYQAFEIYRGIDHDNGLYKCKMMTIPQFWKEIDKDEDLKQELRNKGFRMCKFCYMFKPPRAHHCRQCGTCVLKMDHHCNWLINCVGFNNYKFFIVGL